MIRLAYGMKVAGDAFNVWLRIGHGIGIALGFCLILTLIASAIYAKWINPETEFNELFFDQILGSIPRWVCYVVVLGFGGPWLLGLALAVFLNPLVMIPLTILVGLPHYFRWLYRRLFH